jgi:hypothetical protein
MCHMFTRSIETHALLFGWWLLVPATTLLLVVMGRVKRWWDTLGIFSVASLFTAVFFGAVLALSWETVHDVLVSRLLPLPNGNIRNQHVRVMSAHGGMTWNFEMSDFSEPSIKPGGPIQVYVRRARANTNEGRYPTWNPRFVDPRDTNMKVGGFQFFWADHPMGSLKCHYSVTMPHWFILALCPWFPFMWARRRWRTRHLRRRGFPVLAHAEPSDKASSQTTGTSPPAECGMKPSP